MVGFPPKSSISIGFSIINHHMQEEEDRSEGARRVFHPGSGFGAMKIR